MRGRGLLKHLAYLIGGASITIGAATVSSAVAAIDPILFGSEWSVVEVGLFDSPIALVAQPNTDRLLLAEQAGRVRAITVDDDGSFFDEGQVLDISDQVKQRRVSGMAVSPAGDELYLNYIDADIDTKYGYCDAYCQNTVVAYQMEPGKPITTTPRRLLRLKHPAGQHQVGHLLTDPLGRLLISVGDGKLYGNGQDRTTLGGSLLRITPNPDSDSEYTVPDDNPFAGLEANHNYRSEILAFGLRNPWRFDLDPTTGDLWVTDVGEKKVEEINRLPAEQVSSGANFGWANIEGSLQFHQPCRRASKSGTGPFAGCAPSEAAVPWSEDMDHGNLDRIAGIFGHTIFDRMTYPSLTFETADYMLPVHEYRHVWILPDGETRRPELGSRCSIIGGVVVQDSSRLPLPDGTFLFSDYCDGRIRALVSDGSDGWTAHDLGITVLHPVSFARADNGTIYVLSLHGGVYQLVYDLHSLHGCPKREAEHTVGWLIGEARCHLRFHWSWPP